MKYKTIISYTSRCWLLLVTFCLISVLGYSQQRMVPDTAAVPEIENPRYSLGQGSLICLDEAHNNLHTTQRGYVAFVKLLRRDGYRVKSNNRSFEEEIISDCTIMVIANALHIRNLGGNWNLPTPSAFSDREIDKIVAWVSNGGSLFLIADHMPFPGAAGKLASSFGFNFINGFAMKDEQSWPPAIFRKRDGTLNTTELTTGIDSVTSFTGQAFKVPEKATPIITFDKRFYTLMPDTAWIFNEATPRQDAAGWSQGAYTTYGEGKLVVFGEAAMFSARKLMPDDLKVGFNESSSHQNSELLLNIIHWLDSK